MKATEIEVHLESLRVDVATMKRTLNINDIEVDSLFTVCRDRIRHSIKRLGEVPIITKGKLINRGLNVAPSVRELDTPVPEHLKAMRQPTLNYFVQLVARVVELELLRDEYSTDDPLKDASELGMLAFWDIVNSELQDIYLMGTHRGSQKSVNTFPDHTVASHANFNTFKAESKYNPGNFKYYPDLMVSIDANYIDNIIKQELTVVLSAGKRGFPITAHKIEMPKKEDQTWELYEANVITINTAGFHYWGTTEAVARKFATIEQKYICRDSSSNTVSCSTTIGRAIGGCKVKLKNNIMNQLTF